MPDLLGLSGVEGLGWIIATAWVAGLVRGFSGFGTGLIYVPIAAQFMPPLWTLVTLAFMDLLGPLPNLRSAWRDADRPDLARLCVGAAALLPIGIWLLTLMETDVFRYGASGLALATLAVLITGFRYRGRVSPALIYGIGGAGGFLGGATGQPGPPIIVFYMARALEPKVIRGTILLFLVFYDITLALYLGASGYLVLGPVLLGLCLTAPNLIGNWIGGKLFVPQKNLLYRRVAYVLIGCSAIVSLPIWG